MHGGRSGAGGGEGEPALAVERLVVSYPGPFGLGRRDVLHGIDLRVAAGARLGLVGPNGSGKSSLLRACVGLERPRSGSARVFGRHPDAPEARRDLGYLPEDSPFPRELSAEAALRLLGRVRGLERGAARARAAELLERVGLQSAARRALGGFSRGMLRRFGLAQAFVHRPRIALLDEPTAGLDAPGYVAFAELLESARDEGAALVLCSHAPADVLAHCEQLVVLVDGRELARGAPAEVLGAPGRVARLEGLDDAALAELAREAERRGGRLVAGAVDDSVDRALVALYRRARP